MGMFDTVHFKCPKCGKDFEKQSKAGDCLLKDYQSDAVPYDIAMGLSTMSVHFGVHAQCYHCKTTYAITGDIPEMPAYKLELVEIDA